MSFEAYENTIAPTTRHVFSKLAQQSWIPEFYLAGGTALALRLGHRVSVDLDLFSQSEFHEGDLILRLRNLGKLEVFQKAPQSVTGTLDSVKVSFLGYNYPLLNNGDTWEGITVASLEDIACMKLDALASRGTKRDFIDVFFIAKKIPFPHLIRLFEKKYSGVRFNLLHLKKSLIYFEDAESETMPNMLVPTTWLDVKKFFFEQATQL
jgi:Nucleotidyl transferase AbiEii toxin, Type IV TA system